MTTWRSQSPPPAVSIGPVGWLRVCLRGPVLLALIFGGLVVLLLARLIERPLCGAARPWTPFFVQFVCRAALFLLGVRLRSQGTAMTAPGAVVANHSTWVDIFALNARNRVFFVAKSEVAGWPAIGWLARATGSVFISRRARAARDQRLELEARLQAGHKLLFFPEGTSTDGSQVLGFKSTLFEALFASGLPQDLSVQPVTMRYRAPKGEDPRFYGWWGDMDFAPHLLVLLAARHRGYAELIFHMPLPVSQFDGRKSLALASENLVRSGMSYDL